MTSDHLKLLLKIANLDKEPLNPWNLESLTIVCPINAVLCVALYPPADADVVLVSTPFVYAFRVAPSFTIV